MFNTTNAVIEDNTFTNMSVTTGSSAAITIFDGVSNVSITGNTLQNGPVYGIRIENVIAGPAASDLNIHQNNITGFATAGMFVNDAPTSVANYATCNWWGSDTGPTSALNPSGTGEVVTGVGLTSAEIFNPWLFGLAPDATCNQTSVHLEKSFKPSRIREQNESEIIITLINDNSEAANLTAPLIDTLPVGILVSGAFSTTCGGTLVAEIGSSIITLATGSIPALGSCYIKVKVSGQRAGLYENILPIGALSTDQGQNDSSTQATLEIIKRSQRGGSRSYCLSGAFCGSLWLEPPVLLPLPEPIRTELEPPLNRAETIIPLSIAPKAPEMTQKTSSGCNEIKPNDTVLLLLFMLMLFAVAKRARA